MIKATDFSKKQIHDEACLFFSLLYGVGKKYKHIWTFEEIFRLYDCLRLEKIMDIDCFVNDHEKLMNYAIKEVLKQPEGTEYLGAYYLPGADPKYVSWGTYLGADHIILQWKTPNVSHFTCIDYDPYEPTPNRLFLMSVRYYKIGVS